MALGKVTVLALDSESFATVLGDHVRSMNRHRFELLSSTKLFWEWDYSVLSVLLNHIYVRSPKHGSYVYKRGDEDDNIYVIVSGELEITCVYEYLAKKKRKKVVKSGLKFEHDFMNQYKKKSEITLLKLGVGNYFGDEDGFEAKVRQFNIKVKSNNCKLFLIPKEVTKLNFPLQIYPLQIYP